MKRSWLLRGAAILAAGVMSGPAPAIGPPCTHPRPLVFPVDGCPPLPGTTPGTMPGTEPGTTPGTSPGTTPDGPSAIGGGGGESGSGGLATGAPNMIGDLLGAGRSVAFIINRDRGPVFIEATGATNLTNPKVADDNSPLPRDRIGFRYNYFSNATSIVGLADQTVPAPDRSINGLIRPTRTKEYDYQLYTFSFEKTFLDGQASAQLRVPIRTTLSSRINYSVGTVQATGRFTDANGNVTYYTPDGGGGLNNFKIINGVTNIALSDAIAQNNNLTRLNSLNVNPTPGETLGSTSTELDNLSVILKALLYRDSSFAFTGGLGVTAPTARDTQFTVIDYLGPANFNNVDTMRVRDFRVTRDTWGLAPFVAALYTGPENRFFAQGFLQIDVPVGSDKVSFSETTPISLNPIIPTGRAADDPRGNVLVAPFTGRSKVRDQVLMHADVGMGYWLVRDANRSWITGIIPTLELHYTTTLQDAQLAGLPADPSAIGLTTGQFTGGGNAGAVGTVGNARAPLVENVYPSGPVVGNTRNRLDILNVTLGTTFVVAEQATVAAAVALPITRGDNRTFDWEFQLQLNYYFGGRPR